MARMTNAQLVNENASLREALEVARNDNASLQDALSNRAALVAALKEKVADLQADYDRVAACVPAAIPQLPRSAQPAPRPSSLAPLAEIARRTGCMTRRHNGQIEIYNCGNWIAYAT